MEQTVFFLRPRKILAQPQVPCLELSAICFSPECCLQCSVHGVSWAWAGLSWVPLPSLAELQLWKCHQGSGCSRQLLGSCRAALLGTEERQVRRKKIHEHHQHPSSEKSLVCWCHSRSLCFKEIFTTDCSSHRKDEHNILEAQITCKPSCTALKFYSQ